jgi:hypothetical protein
MKLVKDLLADMPDWAVKEGEDYHRMRRVFAQLVFEYVRVGQFAARLPGGVNVYRDAKGDPEGRPPFVVTPAERQREGLEFVCRNIFADDFFRFDPEVLNSLAPGRWVHWGSDAFDLFVDVPVHDIIASGQYRSLITLMNPFSLGRIYDNELKVDGEDRYTLAEHLTTLTDSIWLELDRDTGRRYTDAKPMISSVRRNLQRMQLRMLLNLVLAEPGLASPADAASVARYCLSGLEGRIENQLESGGPQRVDLATRVHLTDVRQQIRKALEAEYAIGGTGSRGRGIIIIGQPAEQTEKISILPEH